MIIATNFADVVIRKTANNQSQKSTSTSATLNLAELRRKWYDVYVCLYILCRVFYTVM